MTWESGGWNRYVSTLLSHVSLGSVNNSRCILRGRSGVASFTQTAVFIFIITSIVVSVAGCSSRKRQRTRTLREEPAEASQGIYYQSTWPEHQWTYDGSAASRQLQANSGQEHQHRRQKRWTNSHSNLGVSVAQRLGRRISDPAVMGSIPGPAVVRHLGQLSLLSVRVEY